MRSPYRFFGCLGLIGLIGLYASAQDLGSSNKLFGGSKKPAATTAKKKPAAKPKATTAKAKKPTAAKTVARKAPAKNKTAKPETVAAKTKPSAKPNTTAAKKIPPTGSKPVDTRFSEFKNAVITPQRRPADSATKTPRTIGPPAPSAETRRETPPIAPETIEKFEDLIEEGNLARDNRNYIAAESAYLRARPLSPKDSRALYGLGNLYSDQQRWEQSEEAYRRALQIDPNSAIAHVALSYVLTQPLVAPDLSSRYEEAERVARRAIQLAPSNALAFDQLGVALELRGQIGPETESAYRRAILLDSTFAPAYAHLGRLLRRRGQTKEAEQAYRDAIRRSNDAATFVLVAEVLQSEQRYAESEKLLEDALDDDPRNPSALFLLGRALTAQRKFSDSEAVIRKSLEVSPGSVIGNSLLGDLYARQGKFEIAESALLLAVRYATKYERRLLSQQFEAVGDGYLKNNKRLEAERAYRQAIDLDADRETLPGKLSKARFSGE